VTFFWLLVWLFSGAPALHQWNAWLVALIVCAIIDVIGVLKHE